jgi:hypothetical protein
MGTPKHLQDFHCDDYFASPWASEGYWDEPSQLMLVVPVGDHELRSDLDFLVIGRPGVDGIELGYRRGMQGIWVYYPYENRFVAVAATTAELIDGYMSGRITV